MDYGRTYPYGFRRHKKKVKETPWAYYNDNMQYETEMARLEFSLRGYQGQLYLNPANEYEGRTEPWNSYVFDLSDVDGFINRIADETVKKIQDEMVKRINEEMKEQIISRIQDEMINKINDEIKNEIVRNINADVILKIRKVIKDEIKDQVRNEMKYEIQDVIRNEMKDEIENETKVKLESHKRRHAHYSESQKQKFWDMLSEEGCSTYKAALLNDINYQTAQYWVKKRKRTIEDELQGNHRSPKKVGAPSTLTDEHTEFLKHLVIENPTITVRALFEKFRDTYENVPASYWIIAKVTREIRSRIGSRSRKKFAEVNNKDLWAEVYSEKPEIDIFIYDVWAEVYSEKPDVDIFMYEVEENASMREKV